MAFYHNMRRRAEQTEYYQNVEFVEAGYWLGNAGEHEFVIRFEPEFNLWVAVEKLVDNGARIFKRRLYEINDVLVENNC